MKIRKQIGLLANLSGGTASSLRWRRWRDGGVEEESLKPGEEDDAGDQSTVSAVTEENSPACGVKYHPQLYFHTGCLWSTASIAPQINADVSDGKRKARL